MPKGLPTTSPGCQPQLEWIYRLACRNLAALLVGVGAVLLSGPAFSDEEGTFGTRAQAAVLMHAATGAIIFQHNADEMLPPASMSKLMTLAIVFRALKKGRLKLEDEFVVSENAWRRGGAPSRTSAMFVPINTKASISDLIQGVIVQSGNDASIAIAEGMAGTEDAFARQMTERARRLGLTKSVFKNATGLYDPEHLMTARELAILARYLINEFPEYYSMFAQKEFLYRKHKFINRNPLLFTDIGADGLKTGYVKDSGYGLVASAVRGDMRLIAVVMGLASSDARKVEGRRLLEWGFANVAPFKLFDAGEIVTHARVWGGDRLFAPLSGGGDLLVYLPRLPADPKLRADVTYDGPLKPPILKGDQIAVLRVTSSTDAVNEVPLYAAENVEKAGFVWRGIDSLAYLAFRWVEDHISSLAGLTAPET